MSERSPFGEPVFVFGGKVDEFHVALSLHGENLNPEEITRLLGTIPDQAFRKGDQIYPSRTDFHRTAGHWSLSIRSGAPDKIADAIGELLDRGAKPEALRDLALRYQGWFFIGIFLDAENRGFDLPASLVQRIADYGLELTVDIYGQVEDEDDG
jgi:hypothetical protein